jgi:hypothetical protein
MYAPPEEIGVTSAGRLKVSPPFKARAARAAAYVKEHAAQWKRESHESCVHQCLQEAAYATRDHCEAKCP